jgi:hypothetical protein
VRRPGVTLPAFRTVGQPSTSVGAGDELGPVGDVSGADTLLLDGAQVASGANSIDGAGKTSNSGIPVAGVGTSGAGGSGGFMPGMFPSASIRKGQEEMEEIALQAHRRAHRQSLGFTENDGSGAASGRFADPEEIASTDADAQAQAPLEGSSGNRRGQGLAALKASGAAGGGPTGRERAHGLLSRLRPSSAGSGAGKSLSSRLSDGP